MTKSTRSIILFILLATLVLLVLWYQVLPRTDFDKLVNVGFAVGYLKKFAQLAPLISIAILIVQANIPVVPFFVLVASNGMLFGFWEGLSVTLVGTLLGATLNYWWARFFGGEAWVEKGRRYGFNPEKLQSPKVFWVILMARLTPVMPAPLINILSGVSKVPFRQFILASFLGKLPYIVFYTLVGLGLYHAPESWILYLIAALVLVTGAFFLYRGRVKMRSY